MERKLEAIIILLQRKLASLQKRLSSELQNYNENFNMRENQKLYQLSNTRKRVSKTLGEIELFLVSIHRENPFPQYQPLIKTKKTKKKRTSKSAVPRCQRDTFNSKFKKHINELKNCKELNSVEGGNKRGLNLYKKNFFNEKWGKAIKNSSKANKQKAMKFVNKNKEFERLQNENEKLKRRMKLINQKMKKLNNQV